MSDDARQDISTVVTRCVFWSTKQVLAMHARFARGQELESDFREQCVDVDNAALEVLHDVRGIVWTWNRAEMGNKYSSLAVVSSDVDELQSVSDVMFHFLSEQSDYIPKSLSAERRAGLMVADSVWRAKQQAIFEAAAKHHFTIYPNANYITVYPNANYKPSQGDTGLSMTCESDGGIQRMLALLRVEGLGAGASTILPL